MAASPFSLEKKVAIVLSERARAWIAESAAGRPWFNEQRRRERTQTIETVGAQLRSMMPFLDPVTVSLEGDAVRAKEPAPALSPA